MPSAWDAWNIGLTGKEFPSVFRRGELVENNPVRTIIRLYRDYLKPGTIKSYPTEDYPSSFFVQDIILYKKLGRIDFRTEVDWWEDKTMLKVQFPLNVKVRRQYMKFRMDSLKDQPEMKLLMRKHNMKYRLLNGWIYQTAVMV
jgi:alpha-mannosidase